MAYLGAGVIVAAQLGATNGFAAESGIIQVGHRADNLLLLLTTVAFVFKRLFALLTITHVTLLLARVNFAVEWFRADRFARDFVFLTALQRFCAAATPTAALDYGLARWTRSRVAQQRARMIA